MTPAIYSLIISVVALSVAIYGVFERRQAANRADRLRLSVITGEMAGLGFELVKMASEGHRVGDRVEAMHTRIELLGQQALTLMDAHAPTLTSTECRQIALALEESGYRDNAGEVWRRALEIAGREGATQRLFARRGYAYFLFRNERPDEARDLLRTGLEEHEVMDDTDRAAHAQTLFHWSVWEAGTSDSSPETERALRARVAALESQCTTPRGRAMIRAIVDPRPSTDPAVAPPPQAPDAQNPSD